MTTTKEESLGLRYVGALFTAVVAIAAVAKCGVPIWARVCTFLIAWGFYLLVDAVRSISRALYGADKSPLIQHETALRERTALRDWHKGWLP